MDTWIILIVIGYRAHITKNICKSIRIEHSAVIEWSIVATTAMVLIESNKRLQQHQKM